MMLAYTIRPCSTATTMVLKSSSVMIMSAVSLATSVPLIPIATPISAFFRAGASFTPSPVMATISPSRCSAATSCTLFFGDTRAKTEAPATATRQASSPLSRARSRPCTIFKGRPVASRSSPSWRPMPAAVAG
jgi:hypothetical protein